MFLITSQYSRFKITSIKNRIIFCHFNNFTIITNNRTNSKNSLLWIMKNLTQSNLIIQINFLISLNKINKRIIFFHSHNLVNQINSINKNSSLGSNNNNNLANSTNNRYNRISRISIAKIKQLPMFNSHLPTTKIPTLINLINNFNRKIGS